MNIYKDSEQYKLFYFEKNDKFHYPFAKLCDMTTLKEQTVFKNKGVRLGVEIDVFPLDYWDSNIDKAKLEAKKNLRYRGWLKTSKLDAPLTSNFLKKIVWTFIMLCVKLIGGGYFVKKMMKVSNKENQKASSYVGCKAWCIYGEKEIIPAEVFADVTYVEFEGEMFPAPIGYDTYLRSLYGDYWSDPPKEKQKTHHYFKAYRL